MRGIQELEEKNLKHGGTEDTEGEVCVISIRQFIAPRNGPFFNMEYDPIGLLIFLCVIRASVFQGLRISEIVFRVNPTAVTFCSKFFCF